MEEKLEDASRRAANERVRLQDEITQLKEFLGAAKASKKIVNDELGNIRLEAEASARQVQSLQANVQALEQEKADVSESMTVRYLLTSHRYSSKKHYRPLVPRKLTCSGKARGIPWERVRLDRAKMTTSVTRLLASSMFYPFFTDRC
jgi:DNA gyrase/topoisomerase IV subunit A